MSGELKKALDELLEISNECAVWNSHNEWRNRPAEYDAKCERFRAARARLDALFAERVLTAAESTITLVEVEQAMWSSNQMINTDYGPLVAKLRLLSGTPR